jgi:uncharacterized pyridoxamine 5'-phosphate oxidase family protein
VRKFVIPALAVLALALALAPSAADGQTVDPGVRKVFDYLKSCPNYFLATAEGDQPRVRPFGSLALFEGKIYFQTGKIKNVFSQLSVNPRIEICAMDGNGTWIRVAAEAVVDDRTEARQFLLDAHPELKRMYSADDGNTQVLYLRDAVARFYPFSAAGEPETIRF